MGFHWISLLLFSLVSSFLFILFSLVYNIDEDTVDPQLLNIPVSYSINNFTRIQPLRELFAESEGKKNEGSGGIDVIKGGESFAEDEETGRLFTGTYDGRVIEILSDDSFRTITRTGWNYFEKAEKIEESKDMYCGNLEFEPLCGRPLGMKWDKFTSRLIVAEPYVGLLSINVDTGEKTILWRSTPYFKFLNSLVISPDHPELIFFTDSSAHYHRNRVLSEFLSGRATGRLMVFNREQNTTSILIDHLAFANGLCMSHDGKSLLVVELMRFRILRVKLHPVIPGMTERSWGSTEIFSSDLPFFPDNIVKHPTRPTYWVASGIMRDGLFGMLLTAWGSLIRKVTVVLYPYKCQVKILETFRSKKSGALIEINEEGEIVDILKDPLDQMQDCSEAFVSKTTGDMYVGSWMDSQPIWKVKKEDLEKLQEKIQIPKYVKDEL